MKAEKIIQAEFLTSCPNLRSCPDSNKPEYAFVGRSNVGKSSLINMLTGRRNLAKTSQMPGKTLLANYFLINGSWHLVDLPGYGYARRGKAEGEKLNVLIHDYVLRREQLTCLFLLVDVRHDMQAVDQAMLRLLGTNGIPFALVFTKCDKLTRQKLNEQVAAYLGQLSQEWEELPPYFLTSSSSGMGRDEILEFIANVNASL